MRWRTPILSASSVRSLLREVAATKSFPQIAQLHQHLTAAGLTGDPFLSTKLLELYADAGDLPSALSLFAVLPSPSVFAWTPILALLSRSGHHPRCLAAYRSMRFAAIAPDGYVFPPVLRSAAGHHHPAATASLHADAVKFAAATALPVANALINAYSKSGDLAAARHAFDFADGSDLLSWNSIIAAYAIAGCIEPALGLLDSMRSNGFDPDVVTWNTIMDGYCRAGRCSEAREILDALQQPNAVSWTTVISGYSRSGNHEAALEIFSRMMHAGTVPPDPDTLSCVASSLRHVEALRAALSVHAYGLKTTAVDAFYGVAGAALVALYASRGRISTAKAVFDMMSPADVVTWNAVILGFGRAGLTRVALEYFSAMLSRGIRSNCTTIATVLPLCDMKLGKEVHAHVIRQSDAYASSTVQNTLIDMYSRAGCVDRANQVFAKIEVDDVVTWNTMIGAYGAHGLGTQALQLAHRMVRRGLKPDAVTLTSTLVACARCGLVGEGLEFLETVVRDLGLVPSKEQYACVVDLLARAGRFEEAAGLAGTMPTRAGAEAWGSLLSACRTHQNVEVGRLAFEQLLRLEPGNPGNYVTMSNIYVRAARWEDAKKVRLMMQRKELSKPSGHSWIAAGSRTR
ncbi:pentatricopeptide repeat-containing protein At4g35130, chloroplastic-like [Musa acuminata AAA Group]|uniref:pentatricopeptide repeat-containing protein At4g35130, chloroplastic-like n=1 Tax=Musa acuminata AAA Group TaxID=214697 RepID=UPI0031E2C845